ncbi:MAG: trypsin-like peptidase domain-containing protein [Verrucomicrobiota bacterium]
MNSEVAALYENSKPAVLKVHAELPASFARASVGPTHRVGSGFFISKDGRFVTAGTLVEGATTCWIDWRGRRVDAKVIGRDPITNLALLQADTGEPTPSLALGNSDELRVGSMVIAIGFPYDQPSAPVVGFVSGLDIRCGNRVFPVSYIRAGCRLRPGQGGGPLLNARGEVAGIVIAAHTEDQSYALPVNAVKKICADILQHGEPQYGWVGLDISERSLTNVTPVQWQVFVKEVVDNTPAAAGGFQDHDILIRICTNEIRRSADVLNTMFYRRSGESVKMAVLRQGVTQELTIAIGKRPVVPENR